MALPVVPLWFTAPLGALLMLAVAGHLIALNSPSSTVNASRRRIRTTSGVVSLALIPLLVYAFSIVSPSQTRPFLFAWLTVMGLLGITLMLAAVDMVNNARLNREHQRKVRDELVELRARAKALLDEQTAPHADDAPHAPPLKLTNDDDGRAHEDRA
ncbi:MAG: hypothetical protein AAF297_08550 [Planctomycetota bacterium]